MQHALRGKPTISTGKETAGFDAAHSLMLACRLTGTLLNNLLNPKQT